MGRVEFNESTRSASGFSGYKCNLLVLVTSRPRPSWSSNLKVSNQKQITPNSGLYASAFNEYCYEDLQ